MTLTRVETSRAARSAVSANVAVAPASSMSQAASIFMPLMILNLRRTAGCIPFVVDPSGDSQMLMQTLTDSILTLRLSAS